MPDLHFPAYWVFGTSLAALLVFALLDCLHLLLDDDPEKKEGNEMPALKIGDTVLTPDGHIGTIDRIDRSVWEGRDGRPVRLWRYYVDSPRPGTPVVWWLARQLRRVPANLPTE